jgi:hypothetical protein
MGLSETDPLGLHQWVYNPQLTDLTPNSVEFGV